MGVQRWQNKTAVFFFVGLRCLGPLQFFRSKDRNLKHLIANQQRGSQTPEDLANSQRSYLEVSEKIGVPRIFHVWNLPFGFTVSQEGLYRPMPLILLAVLGALLNVACANLRHSIAAEICTKFWGVDRTNWVWHQLMFWEVYMHDIFGNSIFRELPKNTHW